MTARRWAISTGRRASRAARCCCSLLPLVAFGVLGAGWLTYLMINRLKRASGDLADREAQSRHQALHDALSGLPNRHHFVEHLQEQLDNLVQTRNNGRVVVAYIDVDRFKDVNDTMGHAAGDTLIMGVAQRLQRTLSREDFLSRFGGDEFAVLRCAPTARKPRKNWLIGCASRSKKASTSMASTSR
jgi:diguanylate cyclase (GGDEF)-like protein